MKILPMYPSLQLYGTAALVAIELLRDTLDSHRYQPGNHDTLTGDFSRFYCNAIRKVYDADPELYAGVSVHDLRCWVQDCVDVLMVQQTGDSRRGLGYTLSTTLSKISQAQQVEFHNTAYGYGRFATSFFANLIDHAAACVEEGEWLRGLYD